MSQDAYFTQIAERSPLLSAFQPASGLLGKEYDKEVLSEADHHLHIRVVGPEEGLWRISLEAVDGWALGLSGEETQDDRGPFARLLDT